VTAFICCIIKPMRRLMGIVLFVASAAWGADASPARIRDAAAKALTLIQSTQKNWFTKQSCNSCHQQLLPAIAFEAAREHGIPFDWDAARAHATRAFAFLSGLDKAVQYNEIIDPSIGDGYELLGAHAAGVAPNLSTAVYARHIARLQQPDGHWWTGDQRPPQAYSAVTATAIALRAIQIYSHPSLAADTKIRLEHAARWLAAVSPRDTEERTYQLYGLFWAGADRALRARLARELTARQQPDGGWNALDGRPSDVYSTGQVLTAVHEAGGVPISDPAWRRGIQYLLDTQTGDGAWHVASRMHPPAVVSPAYFESGYPYGHDQFVSAMGASWAIRALAAALGPASGNASGNAASPLPEAAPRDVEPWVETAVFGSVADLRQALDKGIDPNAATRAGSTTLLMLVQPDIEKTKLLLARGAQVNRRSKSKYSALMLACLYPGAAPTVRMLLARGAEMRLPRGAGSPLYNASPLMFATFGGNADLIGTLVHAGARVDEKMLVLGMFPVSPTANAISFDDLATTRALLDAGADPNEADGDGITLLHSAVIGNHAAAARLIIERGANVNTVDRRGMTALLYAASADYGDSSMVDLLLKMGADPTARTKEGLTAQDLARRYGHTYLGGSFVSSSLR
jgi:ankyrin repeat protein